MEVGFLQFRVVFLVLNSSETFHVDQFGSYSIYIMLKKKKLDALIRRFFFSISIKIRISEFFEMPKMNINIVLFSKKNIYPTSL